MTHQIDVLSAQQCSCLSRCVRARIVAPSLAVGSPDFLEDNWQTNDCVSLRIDSSVVLVVRLQHVQSFQKNKNRQSFAWKCFVPEQLLLDLAHLEIPIQSTAVYFRAHTLKSTIHYLLRCHRHVSKQRDCIFGEFLSANRHEPFFF